MGRRRGGGEGGARKGRGKRWENEMQPRGRSERGVGKRAGQRPKWAGGRGCPHGVLQSHITGAPYINSLFNPSVGGGGGGQPPLRRQLRVRPPRVPPAHAAGLLPLPSPPAAPADCKPPACVRSADPQQHCQWHGRELTTPHHNCSRDCTPETRREGSPRVWVARIPPATRPMVWVAVRPSARQCSGRLHPRRWKGMAGGYRMRRRA